MGSGSGSGVRGRVRSEELVLGLVSHCHAFGGAHHHTLHHLVRDRVRVRVRVRVGVGVRAEVGVRVRVGVGVGAVRVRVRVRPLARPGSCRVGP